MFEYNSADKNLFEKACDLTFKRLEIFGSRLSDDNRLAISSLIQALDGGLRGVLPPSFLLSSLPPGAGKTEAISAFIRAWKNEGFVPDSSVILCFNTKDEIRSVIDRINIDEEDYACLTSDDSINALGRGIADTRNARVLFTTRQMIINRTKDRRFNSVRDFLYKDGSRPLRVWDESMTLAQHVTIPWTDIVSLYSAVHHNVEPLAEILAGLIEQGEATVDGIIKVPTGIRNAIVASSGHAFITASALTAGQRKTLDALLALEGRSAWQVVGSYGKRAMAGASRPLPADFAPAIITDASGAVRGTYRAMVRAGGELVRLPSFQIDYSQVRIHLWTRSAGKAALDREDDRRMILRTVDRLISHSPDDQWLVIGPKSINGSDASTEIRAYLSPGTNIGYLNWGRHHGTNAYRNVRKLIVIGNYSYSKPDYTSLEIAASGIPVERMVGFHWQEMREGEVAHNMLQGMLRGNARNSDNGIARECDIYLIAPANPDMKRILAGVFPGAVFDEWGRIRKDGLTGQSGQLVDFLIERFADPATTRVRKKEARDAMKINSAQGLTNLLKRGEVKNKIAELGILVKVQHFEKEIS